MVPPEIIGKIITRLAVADEAVLPAILETARKNGAGLLPGDLEKLRLWARFVKALHTSLPPPFG